MVQAAIDKRIFPEKHLYDGDPHMHQGNQPSHQASDSGQNVQTFTPDSGAGSSRQRVTIPAIR
jgi:hypothetical protein